MLVPAALACVVEESMTTLNVSFRASSLVLLKKPLGIGLGFCGTRLVVVAEAGVRGAGFESGVAIECLGVDDWCVPIPDAKL